VAKGQASNAGKAQSAQEIAEDLRKDWKFWQKILSGAAVVVIAMSGWILQKLYDQHGQLAKLEGVPETIDRMDTQLDEINKTLIRLDTLPATVGNLNNAVQNARLAELPPRLDELNLRIQTLEKLPTQLAKSEASLKETAEKLATLNAIPASIETIQASMKDNQGRIVQSIEMLNKLGDRISKVEKSFGEDLRKNVVEALGGQPTLVQVKLIEHEKPLESEGGVIFVFRSESAGAVVRQKYAGAPVVKSVEILGIPEKAPRPDTLIATAEFSGSALVISVWTTRPGELEPLIRGGGLVAAVNVTGTNP
jgi:DNA repair ATPase RecN